MKTLKYWRGEGKYSKLLDETWDKLVPQSGAANTILGEAVRCFGRINYDIGNNGAGNLCDCDYDYDYEEEGGTFISENYYFDFLENQGVISRELCVKLKRQCIALVDKDIDFDEFDSIDEVGDKVGEWVKNKIKK